MKANIFVLYKMNAMCLKYFVIFIPEVGNRLTIWFGVILIFLFLFLLLLSFLLFVLIIFNFFSLFLPFFFTSRANVCFTRKN